MLKRVISLLICVILGASALASCINDEDDVNPRDTRRVRETDEADSYTFADLDFNKEQFVILSPMDDAADFSDNYIDNDEVTGEPMNDAVVRRNKLVEEKYNVDIIQRDVGTAYAGEAARSGTVDFDLVYDWGIRLVPQVIDGVYYDLLSIPGINLDREYWAPSTQDDLTIADKLFIWTGDISMNRIGYAGFMAFNKQILDQFNIEYPYELVQRNEWTTDKLIEMFSQVAIDVNGDQLWGVEDTYGIPSYSPGSVVNASGLYRSFVLKDKETGRYTVNVYSEKLQQIYSKYNNLSTNPAISNLGWEDYVSGRDISKYDSQFQAGRVISFCEGHYAFAGTSMSYLSEWVGEGMDFQFGVVPNPKYETTQDNYYHFIDNCAPMFSIPKQRSDADFEKIGTILEYMNYQSMETLLPAYYEQTIKTKCMSDPEGRDEEMLDIVRDNVYYSWTGLYYLGIPNPSGGTWDPIGTMYGEMIAAGNFKSVNRKYEAAAQRSLDEFYDLIADMDINK
jgi:ABC-type glycerol-3-phosphate transport system substrate-binding protein